MILAVCVAGVSFLALGASFTYVMNDIFVDLQATPQQENLMREAPSLAALLVVFVAGSIGHRLGERRVLVACGLMSVVGFAVVLTASSMTWATIGLLLADGAHSAMVVVGLGLVSSMVSGKDGRAAAFSTYGAAIPVAYIVMPLLAGAILGVSNWRWVAALWIVTAIAGTAAYWKWLPHRAPARSTGELLTPALAGLILALAVEIPSNLHTGGWSARIAVEATALVVCAGALAVSMRVIKSPSFSLAPLRNRGLVLLLVILLLTTFANLWFYTTLALEYVLGLTALEVAAVLIPAQFGSIIGAKIAGRLIRTRGIAFAGGLLLGVNALTLFLSALLSASSPVWLPVTILTVYAGSLVGATVSLTNGIMNTARKGADGDIAAFRSATSSLGAAVSVAVMTSIVFTAGSVSLKNQAAAAGVDAAQVSQLAAAMRDGMTPQDAASAYSLPVTEANEVEVMQEQAYLVAFRTQGVAGGTVTFFAAALFYVVRRRQERSESVMTAA